MLYIEHPLYHNTFVLAKSNYHDPIVILSLFLDPLRGSELILEPPSISWSTNAG